MLWVMLIFLLACQGQDEATRADRITIKDASFKDGHGRQVIFNGINMVNKSKEEQYLFDDSPETYANLKQWGFNCLRFAIIWDGLEPEPGVYNEQYLQEIDRRIQRAADNNMYVILDMHQDLFSVKYADGAPEWATLDEGKEHIAGNIWSDAYLMSGAVQAAFDNFWLDKPAPDGIGVQTHFANLWKHIAARYADNPTVVGYDIMNEPFMGSAVNQALPALLEACGELIYEKTGTAWSADELLAAFGNDKQRMELLQFMSSRRSFAQVIDALEPFNAEFEKNLLQPMYQKVAHAIREVDTTHVLFLEHSYFSNMGVKSAVERVRLKDGLPDRLVAYAPHAYDLVTDTEGASEASAERLHLIYDRIAQKGKQLAMPVWLGEWGAYYAHSQMTLVVRNAISLMESNLLSHAYWSYFSGIEQMDYFQEAMIRPCPKRISGRLMEYHYDAEAQQFYCCWQENEESKQPTIIYVPQLAELSKSNMTMAPSSHIEFEYDENATSGRLLIYPCGEKTRREIRIEN